MVAVSVCGDLGDRKLQDTGLCGLLGEGERMPNWTVGNAGNASELAPLLLARAELLAEWGRDDGLWE